MPAEAKTAMNAFYAARDQQFPGIQQQMDGYFNLAAGSTARQNYLSTHPQISKYWTWQRQYAADNPQAAVYILGQTGVSEAISGANNQPPLALQPVLDYFYQYRDQTYPGINDTQEQYFNLAAGAQRKAFLQQHPELQQYWDWRSMFEAAAPDILPYTRSSAWLSNKVLPEAERQKLLAKASPMLATQMLALATKQGTLSSGGRAEMLRLWNEDGQPMGNFDDFLAAMTGGN